MLGEVAPNVDTKCSDMSGEPLLIVHTAVSTYIVHVREGTHKERGFREGVQGRLLKFLLTALQSCAAGAWAPSYGQFREHTRGSSIGSCFTVFTA